MAQMADSAFRNLNLMAGTAKSLEQAVITPEEQAVWDRDFDLLCTDLSRLVDPDLGADLLREKTFYTAALQVAKGYFNEKPFAGLKAATGQFGFRLCNGWDLKIAASGSSEPRYYSWAQTITTTSAKTYGQYAIGGSSADVYTSNESNKHEVLAWHRLISYKPSPRILFLLFNINGYPYVPYSVEPFSKIGKPDKLFKIIPQPGRVIIHPGGSFHIDFYFDLDTVPATAPSGTTNLDIEVGLFGVVFGEYDYLMASELT